MSNSHSTNLRQYLDLMYTRLFDTFVVSLRDQTNQLVPHSPDIAHVAYVRLLIFVVALFVPVSVVRTAIAKDDPLSIESELINFGDVVEGDVCKSEFILRNRTEEDIKITRVLPGCSCSRIVEAPATVCAGGSATLTVALDTGGKTDVVQQEIVIEYTWRNRVYIKRAKLAARVRPRGSMAAEPSALYLGDRSAGEQLNLKVRLKPRSPYLKNVASFVPSGPGWLRLSLDSDVARKGEYILRASGRIPNSSGVFSDRIVVASEADPADRVVIPINGYISGLLAATPRAVVKMCSSIDANPECDVLIQSPTNSSLSIVNVRHDGNNGKPPTISIADGCRSNERILHISPPKLDGKEAVRGAFVVTATVSTQQESVRIPYLFISP